MARLESFTTAASGTAWEDTTIDVGVGEEVIIQNISGTGTHRAAVAIADSQPTGLVGVQFQNSAGSPNTIILRGAGRVWARNISTAASVPLTLTIQAAAASGV